MPEPDLHRPRRPGPVLILGNNPADSSTGRLLAALAAHLPGKVILDHGTGARGWKRIPAAVIRAGRLFRVIARARALVVHTSGAVQLPAVLLARILRCPVHLIAWDIYPPRGPCSLPRRLARCVWALAERLAFRLAHRVYVPSDDYGRPARRNGADRITVAGIWPTGPALPLRPRPPGDCVRIAYAGSIDRYRDPVALLGGHLGDALRLHVFSNASPRPSALADGVAWEGWLPERDLIRALARFDYGLVCLDGRHAGPAFPSKALTYLRAGIPVLYGGPPQPAFEACLAGHGVGHRLPTDPTCLTLRRARADRRRCREGRDAALAELHKGLETIASCL